MIRLVYSLPGEVTRLRASQPKLMCCMGVTNIHMHHSIGWDCPLYPRSMVLAPGATQSLGVRSAPFKLKSVVPPRPTLSPNIWHWFVSHSNLVSLNDIERQITPHFLLPLPCLTRLWRATQQPRQSLTFLRTQIRLSIMQKRKTVRTPAATSTTSRRKLKNGTSLQISAF